jgi:hypothetical protein
MQGKITTSTARQINLKSALRFLFWSVITGLTFYFIVGHALGYLTNGIRDYFGATLMNAKIWFYRIWQAAQWLSCWGLCNSGKPSA